MLEAIGTFVRRVLAPLPGERLAALCLSPKGQRKLLERLCHRFGSEIRADVRRSRDYEQIWERPCYVFSQSLGFGVEFATVRAAYDRLALEEGWLILLRDASLGIYRPEARWDEETLLG